MSPYALLYREGIYTLVAIPAKDNRIRMYRVDHMEEVEISHADRHEKAVFDAINLEEFANGTFGLSFKPQCEVTLNAHVSLIEAIIDRFGMDVKLTSVSDEVCSFTVPVTLSPEFFGWVLSFGGRMVLTSTVFLASWAMRILLSLSAIWKASEMTRLLVGIQMAFFICYFTNGY